MTSHPVNKTKTVQTDFGLLYNNLSLTSQIAHSDADIHLLK